MPPPYKTLSRVFPTFVEELRELILESNRPDLAAQLDTIEVIDRCR
jgi:hypothetical protein